MNLMWFEKFGFHGYSSYWKLDIVNHGMSDWPGNNREMTSHNNLRLSPSQRLGGVDMVILVNNH